MKLEIDCQRAVIDNDGLRLRDILAAGGFLPEPELVEPEAVLDYVRDVIWWYTTDEEIELSPEIATAVLIEGSDPRSSHFEAMRHQDIGPSTSSDGGWRC